MLKVLGRLTSINTRKVLWLLDEIGTPYRQEDWGKPLRDPNVPEFLRLNPNAQVPVIVEDDFVLWESHAILRYLGATSGSGLLPAEARERALVDQWMSWQSTELNPAWVYVVQAKLRGNPPNPDPARIQASVEAWIKQMRILEDWLASTDGYIANGRFSLADIVIALSTHRWLSVSFDKPSLPAVEAHYQLMRSRPAGMPYLGATTP